MSAIDEDSSDNETYNYTTTKVLLGYTSKEPTDGVSQLGGYPVCQFHPLSGLSAKIVSQSWMDESRPPSASLARCKVCRDMMLQLLQLHGDLPDFFPNHARRLHIFVCKKKACRRKAGSIRAFRCIKVERPHLRATTDPAVESASTGKPRRDLGSEVFGGGLSKPLGNPSPFASSGSTKPNPFSQSTQSDDSRVTNGKSHQDKSGHDVSGDFSKTFAEMARISSPSPVSEPSVESWPPKAALPTPYPTYHIDAEYEILDDDSEPSAALAQGYEEDGSDDRITSAKEDAEAFESTMDRTFQKFADRLAQNPLQILRYEFKGHPLLYSKKDTVGKLLASSQSPVAETSRVSVARREGRLGIPNCDKCGSARVFELQMTPQAIAEVEVDEPGLDGMDWGTIIFGVCSSDCQVAGIADGTVGYVEEWLGVQWEENQTSDM